MDWSKDSMLSFLLSPISPCRPWGARSRSRHLRRARSVPPRAHPWGSRGPATGRSTSPCPPAPRPAHTGAYYLVLSIVCAQLWIHFCGTMVSLEFSSYTSPIFSAHFSLMQHFKDILCSILLQHTITMFVLHKPQTHKGVLCPVCVSNKTHLQPNRVIDSEFRNKDLCVFLPISCGYKKLRRKGVFRKCINSKHSMLPARKLGCIKPTKKWHENHESSSLLDTWIVCSTFIVILD